MGLSCAPPFACHFIAQQVLVFALANVTTALDFRVKKMLSLPIVFLDHVGFSRCERLPVLLVNGV